jgi:hypothetical protein
LDLQAREAPHLVECLECLGRQRIRRGPGPRLRGKLPSARSGKARETSSTSTSFARWSPRQARSGLLRRGRRDLER